MKRIHVVTIALVLGLAAVFGVIAAGRTVGVATTAHAPASTTLAARAHRLDRVERALARARRDRPPALPPAAEAQATPPVAAPRVVYHRPAPIVIVRHTAHHDDQGGHELEHGDD
jgi:hypothetical protein